MYSYGPPHMAEQKQDDQHENTFSNYVRIRDVVQNTCQRRWTIGKSDERGSGISVLPARHDDDDDFNSCCSCSFKPEIIKIGQLSHKMYSNNILNFQDSTTILNAFTKKSGNLLKAPRIYIYIYVNHLVMSPARISLTFSRHSSLLFIVSCRCSGYILYPHIAAVCMFELVVLLLLSHVRGSRGVHHLWARLYSSSSVLHF